jgi:hypothetical protein
MTDRLLCMPDDLRLLRRGTSFLTLQVLFGKKQGLWWLPSAAFVPPALPGAMGAASSVRSPEEVELLKLASAQRMNTDSRRAVFCVLMAADNHVRCPASSCHGVQGPLHMLIIVPSAFTRCDCMLLLST